MRQAGRSLPEYHALRERHSFFEIAGTPELCAEVTLQPVRRHGVDAAVLFADIVSPVLGMGIDVDLVEGVGPVVEEPIDSAAAVERLRVTEPEEWAAPILEAVRLVRAELEPNRRSSASAAHRSPSPAISSKADGAATSPAPKALMYSEPATWHALMERLERAVRTVRRGDGGRGRGRDPALRLLGRRALRRRLPGVRRSLLGARARGRRRADDPLRHRDDDATARRDGGRRRRRGRRRLAHPARRRLGRRGRGSWQSRGTSSRRCCSARGSGSSARRSTSCVAPPAGRVTSSTSVTASCLRPNRRSHAPRGSRPQLRSRAMKSRRRPDGVRLAGTAGRRPCVLRRHPRRPSDRTRASGRPRRALPAARIEDSSPLNAITEQTRAALEAELGLPVYTGMKHWTPRIAEAAESAVSSGAEQIVGLVLAPHYSALSIAGYREQLERALGRRADLRFVDRWYDEPGFVELLADRVRGTDAHVVVTAHSLPARILEAGYRTATSSSRRRGSSPRRRGFALELLLPERVAHRRAVARAGHPRPPRVAAPAGSRTRPRLSRRFRLRPSGDPVGDLDVEAQEKAAELGLQLERIEMPNSDPRLIAALGSIVRRALSVPSVA